MKVSHLWCRNIYKGSINIPPFLIVKEKQTGLDFYKNHCVYAKSYIMMIDVHSLFLLDTLLGVNFQNIQFYD